MCELLGCPFIEQDLLLHFIHSGSGRHCGSYVRFIGFCIEHPCHKVVFIFEMIIESRPFYFCGPADFRNADLADGLVLHDLPHFICDSHLGDFSHIDLHLLQKHETVRISFIFVLM